MCPSKGLLWKRVFHNSARIPPPHPSIFFVTRCALHSSDVSQCNRRAGAPCGFLAWNQTAPREPQFKLSSRCKITCLTNDKQRAPQSCTIVSRISLRQKRAHKFTKSKHPDLRWCGLRERVCIFFSISERNGGFFLISFGQVILVPKWLFPSFSHFHSPNDSAEKAQHPSSARSSVPETASTFTGTCAPSSSSPDRNIPCLVGSGFCKNTVLVSTLIEVCTVWVLNVALITDKDLRKNNLSHKSQ